jgi:hypothetical protein
MEKLSGFTTPTSRALGTVQRALGVGGCGREIFYKNCFGHELIAVQQGQRRDAAATENGKLGSFAAGKSNYMRLYQHSGKLALAAVDFRRDQF